MTSFTIKTAGDLLEKLLEEQADFKASGHVSARHALNATMTAFHLHEWVWGDFAKREYRLHAKWRLETFKSDKDNKGLWFLRFLITQCQALDIAQKITNGTKHFSPDQVQTGRHAGAFSTGFSSEFDISFLWIDRSDLLQPEEHGPPYQERAEVFIEELVDFWQHFFRTHGIPCPTPLT